MADIELVIKVPEEDYLTFSKLSEKEKANKLTYYEKMIAYGKPLPKKHGRLIDADKQITKIEDIYNGYMLSEDGGVTPSDFVEFLEEAPTIIEADKGE